jgi:CBS domain-containing protein/CheY-like chemotaxis protein
LPLAAGGTPISAIMTTDVICVRRDLGIEALMSIFLDRRIGAVPVVDADGFPIGLVSKTDLVRHRFEDADGDEVRFDPAELGDIGFHVAPASATQVGDIMMPLVYTLRDDEPVSLAAALMTVEHVHHVPVVDHDGRVVGMVSSFDFARWIAESAMPAPEGDAGRVLVIDADGGARAVLGEALRREGYDVCLVSTSAAAVRAMREFRADVVLADLDLQSVDAAEMRQIAAVANRPAVLWMAPGRADRAGEATHVAKPVHLPDLLSKIDRALRAAHAEPGEGR